MPNKPFFLPTMLLPSSPFVYSFLLLLSLFLIFLFGPQILPAKSQHPGISTADEIEDLALFHRASVTTSNTISHLGITNPRPKIAFLFLTNTDLPFAPLWDRFFNNNQNLYNIYIHTDPLRKLSFPTNSLLKSRFVIPSKPTARASPTLISAARRLLANALIDDPLNLYFALVSQSCIPLHSFHYIYHSLFGNSTLNAFATQHKHKSYIEILANEPTLQDRYDARGHNVMLPEIPFEEFRVGSQFFTLSKRHALMVIKERKLWRKFRLPCINTDSCYPEEHYFPTFLSMKDPRGCTHYTLTRVNWTDSVGGHPHLYGALEVTPRLVYSLRQSNSTYSHFFARKFSQDCLESLLEIADRVIFKD
ncbi:Branch domain-containing protein [Cephalotus follicularis]|uniref:Branch domain-containing protein n=1 Tax=Cephalotus follicularis TaxID=3775 RepID=A0A1Q3CJJ6_CEPFO|nr:Branch domain-containing protein [Cephalotus follicularis]